MPPSSPKEGTYPDEMMVNAYLSRATELIRQALQASPDRAEVLSTLKKKLLSIAGLTASETRFVLDSVLATNNSPIPERTENLGRHSLQELPYAIECQIDQWAGQRILRGRLVAEHDTEFLTIVKSTLEQCMNNQKISYFEEGQHNGKPAFIVIYKYA